MANFLDLGLAWVIGLSALDVALCGLDKASARRGGKRIPERTLLLVALAGGSPGLILGMAAFRHKTRKPSFLIATLAIVAVHAGALILLAPLIR